MNGNLFVGDPCLSQLIIRFNLFPVIFFPLGSRSNNLSARYYEEKNIHAPPFANKLCKIVQRKRKREENDFFLLSLRKSRSLEQTLVARLNFSLPSSYCPLRASALTIIRSDNSCTNFSLPSSKDRSWTITNSRCGTRGSSRSNPLHPRLFCVLEPNP